MTSVQLISPLTAGQLAELRERLDARERSLREQVSLRGASLEQPAAVGQAANDAADLAAARAHDDVQNTLIEQHLLEIAAIGRARERLQAGSYGTCVQCGGSIGRARLQVHLIALRCAECQQAHESALAAAVRGR
ncbi:MAG: TraR/DksA C4-type zinc finger protein [Burkholderiales bacterium]|nr:TraR/DksA C4-type zinc finger protein [Burkholderiales bacterium]